MGRVTPYVGNSLVQGEQRTTFLLDMRENLPIIRAIKAFLHDRVGVVTETVEELRQLGGEILVDLELHRSVTGRMLSSRASSAA